MNPKNFFCNFEFDEFLATLIPNRLVYKVIKFGDNCDSNKVHHNVNWLKWSNDDADVDNLSEDGNWKLNEYYKERQSRTFEQVLLIHGELHLLKRASHFVHHCKMQDQSAEKPGENNRYWMDHSFESILWVWILYELDEDFNQ